MYKRVRKLPGQTTVAALWSCQGTTAAASYTATGSPFIHQGNQEAEFDVTMPYQDVLPFGTRQTPGTYPNRGYSTLFFQDQLNADESNILGTVYTAVRDDYQIGWLIAPVIFDSSLLKDEPIKMEPCPNVVRDIGHRRNHPPRLRVKQITSSSDSKISTFDF